MFVKDSMCAHEIDDSSKYQLKTVVDRYISSFHEILEKRNRIEKPYLEKTIPIFERVIQSNIPILSKMKETAEESKKILTSEELHESKDALESITQGQMNYYGLLLKSYSFDPVRYSAYDIIEKFNLDPTIDRPAIQRYFSPKPRTFKNQRGTQAIAKIIEITSVNRNGRPLNFYRPKGFLKIFSESYAFLAIGIELLKINTTLLYSTYEKLEEIIANVRKLEDENKSLAEITKVYARQINCKDKVLQKMVNRISNRSNSSKFFKNPELEALLQSDVRQKVHSRYRQLDEYSNMQRIFLKFNIIKFVKDLDESSLGWALKLQSNLIGTIEFLQNDLIYLDTCLFILKFMKAKFQYRQHILLDKESTEDMEVESDPEWRYDGIESFLRLKQELDMNLRRGTIDKQMYNLRLQIIKNVVHQITREFSGPS